ncbi:MAG: hypothetical protein KDK96_06940 [Chlamydiia bacterium]|nr:hypothetical protein [Chlamydiia bacterium]
MRSRNPKIFLRSAIPLMMATVGYSALFQGYAPTISKYIKEHYSKKYSFEIVIVSNTGLYLLFSYVIGKGIEKVVGALFFPIGK